MPRLYITEPQHLYTYELPVAPGAEVLIGSAPHCHLALPGVPGLAERHACITCYGHEYMISDLGSGGGTFANGTPVRSVFLMPGVEYRLGAAVVAFGADGAPPPPQFMAPPAYPVAPGPMPPRQWPPQQPYAAPPYMQMPGYGQPSGSAAPALPPRQEPASSAAAARGPKVRRLNREELDELKSRFYNPRPHGFPVGKVILFVLVLLAIAFFADMLPVHREDARNFLNALFRDLETPASAVQQ